MKSQVCIDASLMVSLLVSEEHSLAAMALWEKWVEDDSQIIAPLLLRYEVTSALYRKALRGQISREDAFLALRHFLAIDIEWIDTPSLPERATELAEKFHRPNTYDCHYLALSEHLDCEFWTGDERLFNAVKSEFGFVRWVGKG